MLLRAGSLSGFLSMLIYVFTNQNSHFTHYILCLHPNAGTTKMSSKIKIIAISGSTRKASSNLNLINAIAGLAAKTFDVTIFDGLTGLPHFNPDLDNESNVPQPVVEFRQLLRGADGILICTPEYAMGVPGTLKNAIDWTVSSMEFSQKPVALITASLSGEKAHKSLLDTLLIIEAKMTSDTQLVIPFVKTKVNDACEIIDSATLDSVNELIVSLAEIVTCENNDTLSAPILMNEGVK
jgi:NAD(P)H-dependent FMN reductase